MLRADSITLIECPRDAWQGLKGQIPSDLKRTYLQALISAGFKHLDAVSFVSPKAVPQMADSEEVLKELEKIQNKADAAGLDVVVYISMAFGNPYGDPWSIDEVIEAIALMEVDNVHMISLADTVGMAIPQQISDLVGGVMAKYDYLEIGVHLHSRPEHDADRILAAYDAGCRRFDSALGGLGGCPFAQDALVGNIATEKVIEALHQRGAQLPPLKPLDTLLQATAEIGRRYTTSVVAD